jgi:hypothetical protein
MLNDRELKLLLYCAAEEKRARENGKCPVQKWNGELIRRVELELAVSRSGHESDCDAEESDAWLSAREAATQLGLSKRQTTRLAADLDGRIIDGRWIFSADAVTEYAKGRNDDRSTA